MSWFDDLQARVNEAIPEGIRNDIGSYLQARVVDPVIKIGQPQTGNLSAAEIAAGARGGVQPVAPAQPQPVPVSMAASMVSPEKLKIWLPLAAVGLAAWVVLGSKRARL